MATPAESACPGEDPAGWLATRRLTDLVRGKRPPGTEINGIDE